MLSLARRRRGAPPRGLGPVPLEGSAGLGLRTLGAARHLPGRTRPAGDLVERAGVLCGPSPLPLSPGCRGEPTPAERNRKNGLHARPHPGPLPQERERRSRRLWKTTRPGVGAPSGWKGSNATDATEAIELSNNVRKFSLSPGERAGVRASLPLTLPRLHHALPASLVLTFGGASYPGPSISGQGVWRPLLQGVENRIPRGLALAAQSRVGHGGEPTPAERNRKNGLHVRPHPGPLPQERGRRSRRLWKPTHPGVGAPSGRKANTLALTPALSPRRGGGARGVCRNRRARVFARLLGGRAAARRMQPGPSSFQTAPGSSPSPRGRGPG